MKKELKEKEEKMEKEKEEKMEKEKEEKMEKERQTRDREVCKQMNNCLCCYFKSKNIPFYF